MVTYYIDPVSGRDTNDGLAPAAAKLTVPPTGANCTYLLKRGTTYRSAILIADSVVGVTIGAYGVGARPVINPGSTARWCIRVYGNAHGAKILGLELTGASSDGIKSCCGIYIGSGDEITANRVLVNNCHIHDITATATGECSGVAARSDDLEVSDCVIENMPDDGIWVMGLRARILNNKISNVGTKAGLTGDCVQLTGGSRRSVGEFRVVGNYMDHSQRLEKQCCIVAGASLGSGGLVAANTCILPPDPDGGGGNACVWSDQPGCRVIDNIVSGGTYGVTLDSGAGQVIQNNLIVGAWRGVHVGATATATLIEHNTVAECMSQGMYVQAADATTRVRSNILYRCVRGLETHGAVTRSGNVYYGNTSYDWSSAGGGGALEPNAITADPELDAAYSPLPSSPALGAGANLGYGRAS